VGAGSIDCQIPLAGDFGSFEMYPLDGEKERKRVERERIGVSSVQTIDIHIQNRSLGESINLQLHEAGRIIGRSL
jgi:hypothetical protein